MSETAETLSVESIGKRERAKAANREAILNAARRVFAEMGYDAATVRDIIRGTDLASGTFYNYFKSKEEVFEALSDDKARRFLPRLQAARVQAQSLEDYLSRALTAYFAFIAHELEDGGGRYERRPLTRTDTPGMVAVFAEVRLGICEAIQRGSAPKVDAELAASAIIGAAMEMGETMLSRTPIDAEGAAHFALDFIMRGLDGAPREV